MEDAFRDAYPWGLSDAELGTCRFEPYLRLRMRGSLARVPGRRRPVDARPPMLQLSLLPSSVQLSTDRQQQGPSRTAFVIISLVEARRAHVAPITNLTALMIFLNTPDRRHMIDNA